MILKPGLETEDFISRVETYISELDLAYFTQSTDDISANFI